MRISNEQVQQILAAQKLKGAKGPAGVGEVGAVQGPDALAMSTLGQDLQKPLAALSQVADVRLDRVAELKARIASGQYQVDGRDIARSVLRRASDQLL